MNKLPFLPLIFAILSVPSFLGAQSPNNIDSVMLDTMTIHDVYFYVGRCQECGDVNWHRFGTLSNSIAETDQKLINSKNNTEKFYLLKEIRELKHKRDIILMDEFAFLLDEDPQDVLDAPYVALTEQKDKAKYLEHESCIKRLTQDLEKTKSFNKKIPIQKNINTHQSILDLIILKYFYKKFIKELILY